LIVLGVTADRRKKLMTTLVPATVLMIGLGYPGEVASEDSTKWLFWVLAMLPFIYILMTLSKEMKASSAAAHQQSVPDQVQSKPVLQKSQWGSA
jgi:bacteriorhodopsin